MASLTDKITDVRNSERPNIARVTAGRSTGDSTLSCDNLSGWPIASKVHFVTYQIDSSGDPVAGTQLDCYGIVSGTEITSFNIVDGSDQGNQVNDVVEMLPTAQWGQDLAEALTEEHNRDGTHSDITADSITTDELVTNGPITGSGFSVATLHNPSKFLVYQSASTFTIAVGVNQQFFDKASYDTSSEFNITTSLFTAKQAGFYWFAAGLTMLPYANTVGNFVALYKNGAEAISGNNLYSAIGGNIATYQATGPIQLIVGDTVSVYTGNGGPGGATANGGLNKTWFAGFLFSAT